jgi:inner membrane transporter RhtA
MGDRATVPRTGAPLERVPPEALVLGATASVQFGASLAATMFDTLGPAGTVLLRLAFGSLLLLALWRPPVHGWTREQLRLAAGFGVVLGAMNLSFYEALDRIPLGIAVAIEFVGPLGVAVAGSRRRLDFLWVGLALLGILALTRGGGHGLDALGVLFALLAGAFWAAYILINTRVGRAFAGGSGLALAMPVGTLLVLPAGIVAGGSELLTPESLALGAAVGMLSTAIPYSLELEALRRMSASVFGVLMSLEPAVAALAGFVTLGQQLRPRELLGIALVTAASIGAARGSRAAPVAV